MRRVLSGLAMLPLLVALAPGAAGATAAANGCRFDSIESDRASMAWPAPPVPGGVAVVASGLGWLLRDAAGHSLYTRSADAEGESGCNETCAMLWPPLRVEGRDAARRAGEVGAADAAPPGWTVVLRIDGTRQWAFRGRPLYRYANDATPGAAFGDGMPGWELALDPLPLPPGLRVVETRLGRVLAGVSGHTLYGRTAASDARCDRACALRWRRLEAPWRAQAPAGWRIEAAADGTPAWSWRGTQLASFDGDARPGDVQGDGVDGRVACVLRPLPPRPDWVSVQASIVGAVLADRDGRTLYTFNGAAQKLPCRLLGCAEVNGGPVTREWSPVLAPADAMPRGNFGLRARDDGSRQWTWKGLPLYTYGPDRGAGSILGLRHGDGRWRLVTPTGEPIQGTS